GKNPRGNGPDVQIVDHLHLRVPLQGPLYLSQIDVPGGGFHQNLGGLPDQLPAAGHKHHPHHHPGQGVEPLPASPEDGQARQHRGKGGEGIGQQMDKGGPQVEAVLPGGPEGVCTSTLSPRRRPSRARPRGDEVERCPRAALASMVDTNLNSCSRPLLRLRTLTRELNLTRLGGRLLPTRTSALARVCCNCWIRRSRRCRCPRAERKSGFFSPPSWAASRSSWTNCGRSTRLRRSNSR